MLSHCCGPSKGTITRKKKWFGSAGEMAQWVRAFAAKSDEFHPRDTHGKKAAPRRNFKESDVNDEACTSVCSVKFYNRRIF